MLTASGALSRTLDQIRAEPPEHRTSNDITSEGPFHFVVMLAYHGSGLGARLSPVMSVVEDRFRAVR